MNKKYITIGVVLIFLIIAVAIGLVKYKDYRDSLSSVTFHFNSIENSKVNLYKVDISDPSLKHSDKPVYTLESNKTYTLSGDTYVIEVTGSGVEPKELYIYPRPDLIDMNINIGIDKSKEFLSKELDKQRESIVSSIKFENPKISKLYNIKSVSLHGDGSWAGVKLAYKKGGPDYLLSRDYLVEALHKDGDTWDVIAGPSITISKQDAPKAPKTLLEALVPDEEPPL